VQGAGCRVQGAGCIEKSKAQEHYKQQFDSEIVQIQDDVNPGWRKRPVCAIRKWFSRYIHQAMNFYNSGLTNKSMNQI